MWKEMHVLDQQELQQDLQSLTALLQKKGAVSYALFATRRHPVYACC